MRLEMNRRLCRLALGLVACLFGAGAWAQAYPSKPLRMIVGFPPGGPSDIVARAVADSLGTVLGQPVVVENRPGAGGNIGTELVTKAQPDGHTLLMGSVGPQAINPAIYTHLPFDMLRDLAPITLVAMVPSVLVVNPGVPARTVAELIAYAKRPGETLRYASGGYGTSPHLAGELFKSMAKIDLLHVPYKGASPALADLVGGQTHLMFQALPAVMPMVKADRLRIVALTTRKRLAALPDVPTIAESGLPGYDVEPWFGVLTTAGTPPAVIQRLNEAIRQVVAMPAVQQAFEKQGAETVTNSPEEFGAMLRAEIEKWSRIVKEAKIKLD